MEGKTTWRGDFWVKIDPKSPLFDKRKKMKWATARV